MDAGDSETPGSRAVTGKTPVMPIPSQYLKQYYAQAMGDNYSPPQEGPNMPYILTPAQQQLAGILQLKQQQQQQLEQQHHSIGIHHPQLLQQQLIYLQQQQLLQQQQQHQHQHELNYRLEMQQHSLNGHHKQKKFGDHNNQSPMDHDKPIPPKPKIKVEPEDEPTQKEEEVLMDQDEDAANRMSKEDQSKSLSQPKPPHLPPVSSAASSSSSAQTAQELTSSAVKKKLQNFVLNKQQRELAVASLTNDSAFKHWSQNMDKEGDDLAPLGSHLDANHFPLRKTASEPNLKVKSRLKAKVAEHRTIGSPLLHRPHRNGNKLHRSMTLETTGNENADRSNPGSPTQSVSASPGRERSSPLGAPGSTFGHSLPNLQAIPRLSANIDRSHINQLMANRFIINHQSLVSQGISNDAEYQSPYANELLYDSMEEDDDSSLNAAALKQVQYKNLALAKAQSKMLGLSGGHLLNSNSLLSRGQHSGLTGRGSPPSQNNLLSIPKSTLSPTSQASSLHHRPLRLTLSAPGYSISNNPQLQQQQQQILKHNQELLQQQQHLQFLQQQRFQQGQSRYLKQLQQDLLMQQLGKQNFPKVQQAEKEPRGTLKDHLEMLQFQKEQQEQAAKEREKAYQQHKKEQQLAQAARTTEDLPSPRALNEQQIQELLIIQQLQRQDPLQRGGLLQQQLLQHQQLLQLRQAEVQAAPSAASASPSASVGHRPLTRAISMPAVGSGQAATAATRTGIVYDTLMLKHQCSCGDTSSHPEHPGRLQSIWARLQETGVTNICERVRPRKATLAEILTVHSEQHTMLYGGSTQCRTKAEDGTITTLKCFNTLPCGGMGVDGDTIWNEIHSANAARMAVGCVVELAYKVAGRELKNGMAIVRPPGHHAEAHQAMGFCYFNNVAIAARLLRLKMSVERVLIVDWDIHHGNGTQQMFYDDPHVLYISIHRHDDETFFPGTGKSEECGAGIGVGYNVNIAWNGGLDPIYGDAEYLAAFRSVVMPIAKEFDPEIILVSAGFDAATGHSPQLGGYKVTAACFAQLTKQLMELADGHLVMSLEGGYSLPSLCDAAEACLRGLLTQELPEVPKESLTKPPNPNAVAVLEKTIAIQSRYWNSVKRTGSLINHSVVEAQQREKEELETVSALASLSMGVNVVQDSDKATDVQMEVQDES